VADLLRAGDLHAGTEVLTFRCTTRGGLVTYHADLLSSGRIHHALIQHEANNNKGSPSGAALALMRVHHPEEKAANGWTSFWYKGRCACIDRTSDELLLCL
jgi:hypothetical protein